MIVDSRYLLRILSGKDAGSRTPVGSFGIKEVSSPRSTKKSAQREGSKKHLNKRVNAEVATLPDMTPYQKLLSEDGYASLQAWFDGHSDMLPRALFARLKPLPLPPQPPPFSSSPSGSSVGRSGGNSFSRIPISSSSSTTQVSPNRPLDSPPSRPHSDLQQVSCPPVQSCLEEGVLGMEPRMNEYQFLHVMRNLTSFQDFEILNIFDFFDHLESGTIGFSDAFLLISIVAAKISAQTTQCLFLHGQELFDLFSDHHAKMNFEQFSRLSAVLGIEESALMESVQELGIDALDLISYDDFILHYFAILDNLDAGNAEKNRVVVPPEPKPKPHRSFSLRRLGNAISPR
ncbi:MAG: hypothetical protein Q8P67_27875 [archaeon]|nr:hypothetical protein [archaeon]